MSETLLKQQLSEIRTQCQYVIEFTSDITPNKYKSNIILKSAIERFLINIGITATQIRGTFPDIIDEVEGLQRAIGVRNRLAHGYDEDIDDDVIWDITQNSIPELLDEIESML